MLIIFFIIIKIDYEKREDWLLQYATNDVQQCLFAASLGLNQVIVGISEWTDCEVVGNEEIRGIMVCHFMMIPFFFE